MAVIFRPQPWTRQPQTPARPSQSKRVLGLFSPGVNSAGDGPFIRGMPTDLLSAVSKYGKYAYFNGTTSRIELGTSLPNHRFTVISGLLVPAGALKYILATEYNLSGDGNEDFSFRINSNNVDVVMYNGTPYVATVAGPTAGTYITAFALVGNATQTDDWYAGFVSETGLETISSNVSVPAASNRNARRAWIGCGANDGTLWRFFDTNIHWLAIIDGWLTVDERQDYARNPWQLFAPLPRRIFVGPAAGGGATTYTKTVTLDAAIQQAKTATATLDAAIQVANTKTATLDGVIATRNTATVTLDAAIQQAVTATVTLDAAIQATITASSTLDAVIQNPGVNTYTATATIDAAIREAKSLTTTLDAAIQIANTKTVTLDGVIVSVNTKTATLDATIQAAATLFALLDAYIFDSDAPVVVPDTRQTPAGKKTRNSRRRYIMPDDTIVMATPDEAEQLVKLFVKPKVPKKAPAKQVVKELRKVDLVEFEPQSSDTVETERIVVKPRRAVWEPQADVYEKAMKLLVDRETKRRRHEEELILLSA